MFIDPLPHSYTSGFFNQHWVQQELGVPINFTSESNLINNIMTYETGDLFARAGMKDVEYLLETGVKIALVYGDRDFRCPWQGAENLALQANWSGAQAFRSSGFGSVYTNASYDGGVARQHGNLSFTRVFQAGHDGETSSYISSPYEQC